MRCILTVLILLVTTLEHQAFGEVAQNRGLIISIITRAGNSALCEGGPRVCSSGRFLERIPVMARSVG